jgi:hypothetical protein
MNINWEVTDRGFKRGGFVDRYNVECSIQESSLVSEPAIWLGCNEGTHHQGQCSARMHLTQEQVARLLPFLQYFAMHGELPATNL